MQIIAEEGKEGRINWTMDGKGGHFRSKDLVGMRTVNWAGPADA